eukprot:4168041-Pleurochrysis_carterae.AAC.1
MLFARSASQSVSNAALSDTPSTVRQPDMLSTRKSAAVWHPSDTHARTHAHTQTHTHTRSRGGGNRPTYQS